MTVSMYILGAPGVGKSSVMRRLIAGFTVGEYVRFTEREMFGHYLTNGPNGTTGAYLGHLRPEFPGTDALSMSVQPHAINWVQQTEGGFGYIFGEGARLGNPAFLQELALRSSLTLVHLTASPDVLRTRIQNRPDSSNHKTGRSGREQDQKWRDGQETRSRNAVQKMLEVMNKYPTLQVLEVDTSETSSPEFVAEGILEVISR